MDVGVTGDLVTLPHSAAPEGPSTAQLLALRGALLQSLRESSAAMHVAGALVSEVRKAKRERQLVRPSPLLRLLLSALTSSLALSHARYRRCGRLRSRCRCLLTRLFR